MTVRKKPAVWSIAGFDPSSGAGVTADIKTLAAHGCYGVACITALTVQSTSKVSRVAPLEPGLVLATLAELLADLPPAAVRIGMLGSGRVASVVAAFLERHSLRHVVLDPILRSSSGAVLLDKLGKSVLVNRLLPLAEVVTPNLYEAAALTGLRVTTLEQMSVAARKLQQMGAQNVVVTGGHLKSRPGTDVLRLERDGERLIVNPRRRRLLDAHGTGCAFATALAARLALGASVEQAACLASGYVRLALERSIRLGRGRVLKHFAAFPDVADD